MNAWPEVCIGLATSGHSGKRVLECFLDCQNQWCIGQQ